MPAAKNQVHTDATASRGRRAAAAQPSATNAPMRPRSMRLPVMSASTGAHMEDSAMYQSHAAKNRMVGPIRAGARRPEVCQSRNTASATPSPAKRRSNAGRLLLSRSRVNLPPSRQMKTTKRTNRPMPVAVDASPLPVVVTLVVPHLRQRERHRDTDRDAGQQADELPVP